MVLVTTQERFNEVVKENMLELSMTAEEAIEAAIEQFEAQGVDLRNIVKSVDMTDGSSPLAICLERLRDVSIKEEDLLAQLNFLKAECDKDVARRVFAGHNGAYQSLTSIIRRHENNQPVLVAAYKTLVSQVTGYPDLLGQTEIPMVLRHLNNGSEKVVNVILKFVKACCVLHEANRTLFFKTNLPASLKGRITDERTSIEVLRNTLGVVRTLCLDDDIRAVVSDAHERARTMGNELLVPLCKLLTKHKADMDTVGDVILTVSALVVRNEFCATVHEAGGLTFILDVLAQFPDSERLNRQCLLLLKVLAGNDEVKNRIVRSGAGSLIVSAMERHQGSLRLSIAGCMVLGALMLRSAEHSQLLFNAGAADVLLQAMTIHAKDSKLQGQGCSALRNMACHSVLLTAELLKAGAEEVVRAALAQHGDSDSTTRNSARAALKDMGCQLELKEEWTGKGAGTMN